MVLAPVLVVAGCGGSKQMSSSPTVGVAGAQTTQQFLSPRRSGSLG